TCCEHPRLALKRSPLARKGVDPRDKREGDGLRGGSGGAEAWALATSARDDRCRWKTASSTPSSCSHSLRASTPFLEATIGGGRSRRSPITRALSMYSS